MGKIYSFRQIEQHVVSRKANFAVAKDMFHDAANIGVRNGTILALKDYGSVAKGTANERSDYDTLIITPDDPSLEYYNDIFKAIKHDTHVSIDAQIIQYSLARLGLHTIDSTFRTHINNVTNEGNVVGIDPLTILRPSSPSVTNVHREYLVSKLRKIPSGVFTTSEERRLEILQRALEAPINVGRRMLQVLPYVGQEMNLPSDDKPTVAHTFREVFNNTPHLAGFDILLHQDQEYTELLQQALRGEVTEPDYNRQVSEMASVCIPEAYRWISGLSVHYGNLLEGNPPTPEGNHHAFGKESF